MAESKDNQTVAVHMPTDVKEDAQPESLDMEMPDSTLTLISSDGKKFEVNRKWACVSKLVRQALENDIDAAELNIPGANANVLAVIIQYMNEHKGTEPEIIEKPLRSKLMKDCVKHPWDAPFIDGVQAGSQQMLYDLILAANYMDIKSLLHLGCAKVASLIKGQPLEKIKEILAVEGEGASKKPDSDSKTE